MEHETAGEHEHAPEHHAIKHTSKDKLLPISIIIAAIVIGEAD